MAPAARVIYSSLFFVLTLALLIVSKPRALFTSDGRIRPFGTKGGGDTSRTVFSFGVVTVAAAILSMFLFSMIDVVFAG